MDEICNQTKSALAKGSSRDPIKYTTTVVETPSKHQALRLCFTTTGHSAAPRHTTGQAARERSHATRRST